jgi:hypothetical protein
VKLKHVVISEGKTRDIKALRIEATEMIEGKWHVLLTDACKDEELKEAIGFSVDTNEDD